MAAGCAGALALLLALAAVVAAQQWQPGDQLPGKGSWANSSRRRQVTPATASLGAAGNGSCCAAIRAQSIHAHPLRPAAFSVPTLGGALHVGGGGAAAAGRAAAAPAPAPAGRHVRPSGPLIVVCYDAAHPGSRAMWREPASLDALLNDAPADAQFLLLPLNGECS